MSIIDNMKKEITKEEFYNLYINQNKRKFEVCKILGITKRKFTRLEHQFNIKKDNSLVQENRKQFSLEKYGVEHHNKSDELKDKSKQTCLEKYGVDNVAKAQEIKDKIKQTFLNNWGVDNPNKCDEIKVKIAQTNLERYGSISPFGNKEVLKKYQEKCIEKYGSICSLQNEKVKAKSDATKLIRYGTINCSQNKDIARKISKALSNPSTQEKISETRSKNNSWNTSKPEEEAYQLLVERFGEGEVLRQYRSEFYPFNCDFYIKPLDLYIECQFTWTHGRRPYDINNPTHQKLVEKWHEKNTEYYDYAIKVWTIKDPEKRRIAKENNLNWKEFFSFNDFLYWLTCETLT